MHYKITIISSSKLIFIFMEYCSIYYGLSMHIFFYFFFMCPRVLAD